MTDRSSLGKRLHALADAWNDLRAAHRPMVCFLTDFGLADHYVGVMKAVILNELPTATIVDFTHSIPAQDVRMAAFQLMAGYRYCPPGALFLCVVDPGVGTERKILYAEAGDWRFLAPDNGLLSWVLRQEKSTRLYHLDPDKIGIGEVSRTFHGRDLLAPAAARILRGEDPASLGSLARNFVSLPFPAVKKIGSLWLGEILAVDGYGNLVTNLKSSDVLRFGSTSKLWFEIHGWEKTVRGLSEAYASVRPGKALAIVGSSGFIELAVRDGSLAAVSKAEAGHRVTLHFRT